MVAHGFFFTLFDLIFDGIAKGIHWRPKKAISQPAKSQNITYLLTDRYALGFYLSRSKTPFLNLPVLYICTLRISFVVPEHKLIVYNIYLVSKPFKLRRKKISSCCLSDQHPNCKQDLTHHKVCNLDVCGPYQSVGPRISSIDSSIEINVCVKQKRNPPIQKIIYSEKATKFKEKIERQFHCSGLFEH